MTQHKFNVQSRDENIKAKKLRSSGLVPANIYGVGKKSTHIAVDPKKFVKLYEEVGETSLVYLQVDEKKTKTPVLIDDVQKNVLTRDILHISFKQVDLKDKIKAEIPIEVIGDFDVPNTVLVTVKDSIEVEALPTDLPEKFEVSVEGLTEIGQVITLNDLNYDKQKVEIMVGEDGLESPVLIVQELKEEVVEEVEEESSPEEDVSQSPPAESGQSQELGE